MLKRLLIAACLCALLCAPALAQEAKPETYRLRETFSPGERWMLTTIMIDQTVDVEIEGDAHTQEQTINQLMVMKMVIGEPDENGTKTATLTYERIVQQMDMGDAAEMKGFYDSANPKADSPLASQMQPLTKLRFTVTIDKDHQITDVKGFDELIEQMQKNNPQAAAMLAQMKENFGNEQIKTMFQQGTDALPKNPVAVGATWTQKIPLPVAMIGDVKIDAEYKLAEVGKQDGRDIARIEMESKGELAKQAAGAGPANMTFEKFDLTQTGSLVYDVEKERIARTEIKQAGDIGGTMTGGTLDIDQFLTLTQRISDTRDTKAEKELVEKLKKANAPPSEPAPAAADDAPPANDF